MAEEQMRAKFENAVRSGKIAHLHPAVSLAVAPAQVEYIDTTAEAAWSAWQAAKGS